MLTKSLLFSEERKCEEYCMYSEKDQDLFTASLALFAQRHALQGDADGLGVWSFSTKPQLHACL